MNPFLMARLLHDTGRVKTSRGQEKRRENVINSIRLRKEELFQHGNCKEPLITSFGKSQNIRRISLSWYLYGRAIGLMEASNTQNVK